MTSRRVEVRDAAALLPTPVPLPVRTCRAGRTAHAPSAPPTPQDRRPWARKKRIISAEASGPMGSV